jgi:hypothetical protein
MIEGKDAIIQALTEAKKALLVEQNRVINKMKIIAEQGKKQHEQSMAKSRH